VGAPENICSQVIQVVFGAGNRAALGGVWEETLSVWGDRAGIPSGIAFLRGFLAQWDKVVESGRKWYKVEESGGKRGEAKVHRDHPGWFLAVRAPLG
jgi:hypothetical protein